MKVGDLVRDIEAKHFEIENGLKGHYGIIVETDPGEGMYKVMFNNGSEWLTQMFLEVISESRCDVKCFNT